MERISVRTCRASVRRLKLLCKSDPHRGKSSTTCPSRLAMLTCWIEGGDDAEAKTGEPLNIQKLLYGSKIIFYCSTSS